jgi:hypothetical protein
VRGRGQNAAKVIQKADRAVTDITKVVSTCSKIWRPYSSVAPVPRDCMTDPKKSCFPKRPNRFWSPTNFLPNGAREADRSPQSITVIKN